MCNHQSNNTEDVLWASMMILASITSAAVMKYSVAARYDPEEDVNRPAPDVSAIEVLSAYSVTYQAHAWLFRVNAFVNGLILLVRAVAVGILIWLIWWAL
jgi:hypothetical protein